MIEPLIDARDVQQAGMGVDGPQQVPVQDGRTLWRGAVSRVYPVGHPSNRLGQVLVDVQLDGALHVLSRVPVALGYQHSDTAVAAPESERRQPFAPRARSRMEGAIRDLRPGTLVAVQFLGGDLRQPVVVATFGVREQQAATFPVARQRVDRLDDDGALLVDEPAPLDSDLATYPRAVDVYNGVRVEVDNRGNRYIQTSIDREPVWPGHNGIPASPRPQGNYGVSTRGARVGAIGFTTGRHPDLPDEESQGRQFRRALDADDGTIRDETKGSKKGNFIRRLASVVGRVWTSTRGSGNGSVYHEDRVGDYVALTPSEGRAELHGEQSAVLDAIKVYLGHRGADRSAVSWEELTTLLSDVFAIYDRHGHPYLAGSTPATTSPPIPADLIAPVFEPRKTECKSEVVKLDLTASADPEFQEDPDDGADS